MLIPNDVDPVEFALISYTMIISMFSACCAAVLDGRSFRNPNSGERPTIRHGFWKRMKRRRSIQRYKQTVRCTPDAFDYILGIVTPVYIREFGRPHHNTRIHIDHRLALTLYYLGRGKAMEDAGTQFGVSKTSAVRYSNDVDHNMYRNISADFFTDSIANAENPDENKKPTCNAEYQKLLGGVACVWDILVEFSADKPGLLNFNVESETGAALEMGEPDPQYHPLPDESVDYTSLSESSDSDVSDISSDDLSLKRNKNDEEKKRKREEARKATKKRRQEVTDRNEAIRREKERREKLSAMVDGDGDIGADGDEVILVPFKSHPCLYTDIFPFTSSPSAPISQSPSTVVLSFSPRARAFHASPFLV